MQQCRLSRSTVIASIAVSDMARAREFYEGKLALGNGREQPDGGTTYPCGGGTSIHVFPSPDNAGKSGATLARWDTDDVEAAVDELASNGVAFEHYGDPIRTNEKGIADGVVKGIAWFRDPDGNMLAVAEG